MVDLEYFHPELVAYIESTFERNAAITGKHRNVRKSFATMR
jgi:hypothetical protein